jgi:hypothetical protein
MIECLPHHKRFERTRGRRSKSQPLIPVSQRLVRLLTTLLASLYQSTEPWLAHVQRSRNAPLLGWLVLCVARVTTHFIVQALRGNSLREVLPRHETAKRWVSYYCVDVSTIPQHTTNMTERTPPTTPPARTYRVEEVVVYQGTPARV